jgi:putative membrane protein
MPYYQPMMHWYPFMGIGMGLFWLILSIAVAYFIYKLIKSEKILAPNRPVIKGAEDILAERYAKGELTREQYMQMKEDLKKVQ